MKVGKHFSLDEFTVTQEGTRRGLDNTPNAEVIENIKALCEKILDPLREAIGIPIVVTSGYRSPAVNKAVGGSRTSQHVQGMAADIIVPGWTVEHVVEKIRLLGLPVDQVIDEFTSWTHVSYVSPLKIRSFRNRHEFLKARKEGKKTVYSRG